VQGASERGLRSSQQPTRALQAEDESVERLKSQREIERRAVWSGGWMVSPSLVDVLNPVPHVLASSSSSTANLTSFLFISTS
jgi:hypothetical protein